VEHNAARDAGPGRPDGFPDGEWQALPDPLPWAAARLGPGAWDAWVGARRDEAEDELPVQRDVGAEKLAGQEQDGQAPDARQ
jgi:hypothetical protein